MFLGYRRSLQPIRNIFLSFPELLFGLSFWQQKCVGENATCNPVMNYCNPEWLGNGNLSAMDITGVQTVYGTGMKGKDSRKLGE